MKFFTKLSWIPSLMAVIGLLAIASCGGDDEKPKPKVNISFEEPEIDVYEGDDLVKIKVVLDKPAPDEIVVKFSFGGDAEQITATNSDGDFINDQGGFLTIPIGATEGEIEIALFEDNFFEIYEDFRNYDSLIITLNSVISGSGVISEESTHVLYILEDDLLMLLDWEVDGVQTYEGVDLDLFLWVDLLDDEGYFPYLASLDVMGEPELIILRPFDSEFDLATSVVYYEGESDDVKFYLTYLDFGVVLDDVDKFERNFEGEYGQINLNNYGPKNTEMPEVEFVQHFQRRGGTYIEFTNLTIPSSGSRRSNVLNPSERKFDRSLIKEKIQKIMNRNSISIHNLDVGLKN